MFNDLLAQRMGFDTGGGHAHAGEEKRDENGKGKGKEKEKDKESDRESSVSGGESSPKPSNVPSVLHSLSDLQRKVEELGSIKKKHDDEGAATPPNRQSEGGPSSYANMLKGEPRFQTREEKLAAAIPERSLERSGALHGSGSQKPFKATEIVSDKAARRRFELIIGKTAKIPALEDLGPISQAKSILDRCNRSFILQGMLTNGFVIPKDRRPNPDKASTRQFVQAHSVRPLPSGDWAVVFADEAEAAVASANIGWVAQAHKDFILRNSKLHCVIVDYVPCVGIDPSNDDHLQRLKDENNCQSIVRASWVKKDPAEGSFSPLRLFFTNFAEANKIIDIGFRIDGLGKRAYRSRPPLMQCAKCHKVGHKAADCKSDVDICSSCGEEGHSYSRCPCTNSANPCTDLKHCSHPRPLKCCNCGDDHHAHERECRYLREARIKHTDKHAKDSRYAPAPRFFPFP